MVYSFIRAGILPLLFALIFVVLFRGVGMFGFFTIGWAAKETRAAAVGIGSLLAGIAAAVPLVSTIVWFLFGALWTGGVVLKVNESEYK
jgi:hypothetical protein